MRATVRTVPKHTATARAELDVHVTELALQAGRGHGDALTEFIRMTQRDVWRLIAHLTSVDDADDLTQETFLRAIGSLSRFAGRSSARTWLLGIARRTVVDHFRRAGARPKVCRAVDWTVAHDAAHIADLPPGGTGYVEIRDLLDMLAPERREALVLTQLLGFDYAAAAAISGCKVGTIRSRVARARAQLVDALRAEGSLPTADTA